MPTEWEMGFAAGWRAAHYESKDLARKLGRRAVSVGPSVGGYEDIQEFYKEQKPKRKLSAWQKFIKTNSKKKKYIYQSGAKRGKLNLRKMGVDYRKKKR